MKNITIYLETGKELQLEDLFRENTPGKYYTGKDG